MREGVGIVDLDPLTVHGPPVPARKVEVIMPVPAKAEVSEWL